MSERHHASDVVALTGGDPRHEVRAWIVPGTAVEPCSLGCGDAECSEWQDVMLLDHDGLPAGAVCAQVADCEMRAPATPAADPMRLLAQTLHRAYAPATAANPDRWTPTQPARGHADVVALVVQDVVGGTLQRVTAVTAEGESFVHYVNVLNPRCTLDFTREQFGPGVQYHPGPVVIGASGDVRAQLLADLDTVRRYRALHAALAGVQVSAG